MRFFTLWAILLIPITTGSAEAQRCSGFPGNRDGRILVPGSPAEAVQIQRMEDCSRVVTWARACIDQGQVNLVFNRLIDEEIRSASPKQVRDLRAALLRGFDAAAATKWPDGLVPCDAIKREISGLAAALGMTARDMQ
jgi:hypothetical protein